MCVCECESVDAGDSRGNRQGEPQPTLEESGVCSSGYISECVRSDMRPFSTKLKVKLPKIWASLGEVSLGKSQHVMHAYTS